jgi:archaellum component FlaG (FlaF/FlaG flagellin family)
LLEGAISDKVDNFIVVVIIAAIVVGFTLPILTFSLVTSMGQTDQSTCNKTNNCQ